MRTLLGLACGLLFRFTSAAAGPFDEAAIIQMMSPDKDDSTAKSCVPDGQRGVGLRFFAIVRQGTQAVMSTYAGNFSATDKAYVAPLGDGRNATLMLDDDGDELVLKLDQEGGKKCVYDVKLVAGSLLGLPQAAAVDEAGVFKINTADDQKSSPGVKCDNATDDLQDQYAFVRSDSLSVMGGLWGLADENGAKVARSLGKDRYQLLKSGSGLVVATNSTSDAKGARVAGGCVFPVTVTQGSVLGVAASGTNTTKLVQSPIVMDTPSTSLRGAESAGDKLVCRQTCGPGGACRTVCRDIWAL